MSGDFPSLPKYEPPLERIAKALERIADVLEAEPEAAALRLVRRELGDR